MALEGTLDVLRLPEVLQMVSMQQKTGILTVQGESDIIAVSFLRGQVVAADALNQTVEEGLGQVLASEGLVRPEDFQRVSAEHATGGQRLVELLVGRNLLGRDQVLEALRLQTYRLLLQVLRWEAGEFKFYSGEEVSFEDGFHPISVEELLIRSVGDLGDHSDDDEVEPPRLESAYQRVAGTTQIKIFGEDGDGPLQDASALWLAPAEKALLQRLDGMRPAGQIGRDVGLDPYQVLYALYRLLQAGLVEKAARAVAPPPVVETLRTPSNYPAVASVAAIEFEPMAPSSLPEFESVEHDHEPDAQPAQRLMPWVAPIAARALAVGAAVFVMLAVFESPRRLLLPFPWQEADREAFAKSQLEASWRTIDMAARSFYLVEGRFPSDLAELVAAELVEPERAFDPDGDPVALTTEILGYRLEPIKDGEPVTEMAYVATVVGDLLLDPEAVSASSASQEAPLVLLD